MSQIVSSIYGKTIIGGIRWVKQAQEHLDNPLCLEGYGFQVYSQNDEDGIIEEIFDRIGTDSKIFVEFGVGNGLENNSHYLLHKGWEGLWIEGGESACREIAIRFRPAIKNGQLTVYNQFITKDNIDTMISGFVDGRNVDFLSIDIDGNDYYVWDAIRSISPRVVCIEYNGKFPPNHVWSQAYNENHVWDGSDWHGASLKALEKLGREKGYTLVGTNLTGVNAFFVRDDLVGDHFFGEGKAEELFNPMWNLMVNFRMGHPARYYTGLQEPDIGIENYVLDENDAKILQGVCLPFSFPIDKVKQGAIIALWGIGAVGRSYIDQIIRSNHCRVSFLIDEYNNDGEYRGIPIVRSSNADLDGIDAVVISMMDATAVAYAKKVLLSKGFPAEKIFCWSLGRIKK